METDYYIKHPEKVIMMSNSQQISPQFMVDPAYRQRVRYCLNWLRIVEGEKVLDCGCGEGVFLSAIAPLQQVTVCGLDLSAARLRKARAIQRSSELVLGTAARLPFREAIFDKILLTEVLEHVTDDIAVLAEITRVLCNDGILVITVPNRCFPLLWDPINWILTRLDTPLRKGPLAGIWESHVRLYTKEVLETVLVKSGLAVLSLRGLTTFSLPMHHTLLGLLIRCRRFSLLRYVIKFTDYLNQNHDALRDRVDPSVNIVVKCQKIAEPIHDNSSVSRPSRDRLIPRSDKKDSSLEDES